MRRRLSALDLEDFYKTTGGERLHVATPLSPVARDCPTRKQTASSIRCPATISWVMPARAAISTEIGTVRSLKAKNVSLTPAPATRPSGMRSVARLCGSIQWCIH